MSTYMFFGKRLNRVFRPNVAPQVTQSAPSVHHNISPRVHRHYQQPSSSSSAPQVLRHPYRTSRGRATPQSNNINVDRSAGPVSIRELMRSKSPRDQDLLGKILDAAITESNRERRPNNKNDDALKSTTETKSRLNPDAQSFVPQQPRQHSEASSSSSVPQVKSTLNPNATPFIYPSASAPTPTHDSDLVHTAEQQKVLTGVKRRHGEPKEDDVVYCNTKKEEEEQQPPRKKQWTIVEFYLRPLRQATFVERDGVDYVGEQFIESEKNAIGERIIQHENMDIIVEEVDERKNNNTTVEQRIESEKKNAIGEQGMQQENMDVIVGQATGEQKSKNESVSAKQKQTQRKPVTLQDRASRFGATNKSIKYDKMKQRRIIERQMAIRNGTLPNPNSPTRLEDAIDLRGTCEEMCPDFEVLERELQNNVDAMELNEDGQVDPERMVKAYRRSAAGNDQPLPSEVLTPDALCRTMDYLIDEIIAKNDLESCHSFVRDRTRAIRQEFTRQNIRDHRAINVFEKIARFHIVCLHEMSGLDESKFSHQQEMEQLQKVLISLVEFYDDLRQEGVTAENEGEFRAYHIIAHFRDQDVVRQAMSLPLPLFKHPHIQLALNFHSLAQRSNEIMETATRRNKPPNVPAAQNNYSQFFKLVAKPETPFLMACLLESHFADVRKGALKAMNSSYVFQMSGVPASYLERVLGYDNLHQLMEEAHLYGLVVDESFEKPTFRFGQKHFKTKQPVFREPLTNPPQRRSAKLVEPKKSGLTLNDIVRGESTVE